MTIDQMYFCINCLFHRLVYFFGGDKFLITKQVSLYKFQNFIILLCRLQTFYFIVIHVLTSSMVSFNNLDGFNIIYVSRYINPFLNGFCD